MKEMSKKIVKERDFVLNGREYTARLYVPEGKSTTYGEVVYKDTQKRPGNMKNAVRQYLRPYGIDISTNANEETTHSAVKKLIDFLENRTKR